MRLAPASRALSMGAMSPVATEVLARAQHAVDELVPEGVRVEILNGLLVVNPPASLAHGELTGRLAALLAAAAPAEFTVNATGVGVYRSSDPLADYQVPDVVVYRRPTETDRLPGRDVEVVAEVVSPANRRQARYEDAIVARAGGYKIPWVLIIDPEVRTARWWRDGTEQPDGPHWVNSVDPGAIWGS